MDEQQTQKSNRLPSLLAFVGWGLFAGALLYGHFVYGPIQYEKGSIVNRNPTLDSLDSRSVDAVDTSVRQTSGIVRAIQGNRLEIETTIFIKEVLLTTISVEVTPATTYSKTSVEVVSEGAGIVREESSSLDQLTIGDTVDIAFQESDSQPFQAIRISHQ